jgi:TPP-dependent 2-oxoacid decarboxylase
MYVSRKQEAEIDDRKRTILLVDHEGEGHFRAYGYLFGKDEVDVFYDESEYRSVLEQHAQACEEVQQLIREIGELRAKTALRIPALPRKVAEALEKERGALPDNAYILWKSSRDDAKERKYFSILHEFVNQKDNIFKLADALRYGYMVKEPTIRDEIDAIIEDCGDDRRQLAERLADLYETRLKQEREKSG